MRLCCLLFLRRFYLFLTYIQPLEIQTALLKIIARFANIVPQVTTVAVAAAEHCYFLIFIYRKTKPFAT